MSGWANHIKPIAGHPTELPYGFNTARQVGCIQFSWKSPASLSSEAGSSGLPPVERGRDALFAVNCCIEGSLWTAVLDRRAFRDAASRPPNGTHPQSGTQLNPFNELTADMKCLTFGQAFNR